MQEIIVPIVIISLFVEIAVEVEKSLFTKIPANMLALVTSAVITIAYAIMYIFTNDVSITPSFVVEVLAVILLECYISMFGYDKLIQTIEQYKDRLD